MSMWFASGWRARIISWRASPSRGGGFGEATELAVEAVCALSGKPTLAFGDQRLNLSSHSLGVGLRASPLTERFNEGEFIVGEAEDLRSEVGGSQDGP